MKERWPKPQAVKTTDVTTGQFFLAQRKFFNRCVCVCVFFSPSYEFKFLLRIFLQENFVAAFNFCPCGTNHLQKIVPYNSKFWAAEDGPLSELDFPQNLQLKNSFPIHELTEVKGKGRYFTFHQKNRHRFTGKDLTVMGLQEKVLPAFHDKAIELLGKRKLNEFDSLVKSSRATQNHPTIRQQVQLLATNNTPVYVFFNARAMCSSKKTVGRLYLSVSVSVQQRPAPIEPFSNPIVTRAGR